MTNSTVKKFFGTVIAALTLTMVTTVAPAEAAKGDGGTQVQVRRDSGWGAP